LHKLVQLVFRAKTALGFSINPLNPNRLRGRLEISPVRLKKSSSILHQKKWLTNHSCEKVSILKLRFAKLITLRRLKKNALTVQLTSVPRKKFSFERTVITGNSLFDHYQYGRDKNAMSEAAIRGIKVFTGQRRCVSCHTISQTHALFTTQKTV